MVERGYHRLPFRDSGKAIPTYPVPFFSRLTDIALQERINNIMQAWLGLDVSEVSHVAVSMETHPEVPYPGLTVMRDIASGRALIGNHFHQFTSLQQSIERLSPWPLTTHGSASNPPPGMF